MSWNLDIDLFSLLANTGRAIRPSPGCAKTNLHLPPQNIALLLQRAYEKYTYW